MSNKPEFLLWCDIETTGLNPETDAILEMALVLTTPELEEINRWHRVFQPSLDFSKISPEVKEMHEKNGLWNDVITKGENGTSGVLYWIGTHTYKGSTVSPSEYEYFDHFKNIYLAGSSVHFDRQFLKAKKGYFIDSLSHRIVDVSVVRTLLKMWGREDLMWPQNNTHRAMDDILDHIEELKHYRKVLDL